MSWELFLKVYSGGVVILISAIILNLVAKIFKISTWYDLIFQIKEKGIVGTLISQSVLSLIFLFIIYPLFLGIVGYLIFRYLK